MNWLLNLPPQASSVAKGIDWLHYSVILTTFAGVALVAVIAAYFVIRYRRRDDGPTPRIVAPGWLEGGVIVVLLVLFVGWWVVGFQQYRELETAPSNAIPVYVTAKQWMWKFQYADGPSSTDVLVVPVNQPIKLIMQSRDVIHSFFVPAFRIKQDVVPGRATTAWFEAIAPGTYDIECAQYCGTRHSLMRGQVVVLPAAQFELWRANAEPDHFGGKGDGSGLAAYGRVVAADHGCLRCHTLDGTPSIGPTWLASFGRTRRLADGTDVLIDEQYLTESMMEPNSQIAAGFQPVMPTYRSQLEPADVAAIVELIRSLRDAAPSHDEPRPTHDVIQRGAP
ncbi:MAG TPA: cytochrome c oxidase subunit II [Kofleriaceae bacterium]|jgi:cytochrome c oxidase subunit 2|nr:cytochrome c oxidase subunit II [Kofleriaceae bacterium]